MEEKFDHDLILTDSQFRLETEDKGIEVEFNTSPTDRGKDWSGITFYNIRHKDSSNRRTVREPLAEPDKDLAREAEEILMNQIQAREDRWTEKQIDRAQQNLEWIAKRADL